MLYLKAFIHPDTHLPQGTIDTAGRSIVHIADIHAGIRNLPRRVRNAIRIFLDACHIQIKIREPRMQFFPLFL